jgi:hypothetical protein
MSFEFNRASIVASIDLSHNACSVPHFNVAHRSMSALIAAGRVPCRRSAQTG